MKLNRLFLLMLAMPFFAVGTAQTITIKNNSENVIKEYVAEIPVKNFKLSIGNYVVVSSNGAVVPLEIVKDLKGNELAVFPIEKLDPKSTYTFKIQKGTADNYPKRTYAELAHKIGGKFNGNRYEGGFSWVKPNYMKIPGSFRDHAYYIKYEGPGWESDKVGYRFYVDQRNAIDAFGKKTPGIVLPAVGVDGYDNYHNMADWGMDNMKVGATLGIGSIGYYNGTKTLRVEKRDSVICFIPADGKIRSQVNTTYFGWDVDVNKFNLKSLITIDAGTKASRMELFADKNVDNLTTGIIKNKNTEFIKSPDSDGEWAYIATYGLQSLNDDNLGFAIFYKKKQLKTLTEDAINHLVVLQPDNGYVEYYFMASWEMDWEPANNKAAFLKGVDEQLVRLNSDVDIKVKRR
ncbi:MAG: DUF4861 domain-containing protein [Porphyromonadaceae bacterium]|nr:DUF4861 domain-containing protein [Porphyromonadaceae bacterium]